MKSKQSNNFKISAVITVMWFRETVHTFGYLPITKYLSCTQSNVRGWKCL